MHKCIVERAAEAPLGVLQVQLIIISRSYGDHKNSSLVSRVKIHFPSNKVHIEALWSVAFPPEALFETCFSLSYLGSLRDEW